MEAAEKRLLEKFLDGVCSAEELTLAGIILDSQEGQYLLDELLRQRELSAWNNPEEPDPVMKEVIRSRLEEVQQRIAAHENQHRSFADDRRTSIHRLKIFRYAAVWTGLLILAGFAVWQIKKNRIQDIEEVQYVEKVNPIGSPVRYALPDSTVVFLAAGSSLKYPATYPETGRDVVLQGEAFFDVKQDEAHPFNIRSGNMQTRVLGTSFKVKAYEGHEQEVAVITGKVSVSAIQEEKATALALLTPGLKVTYNPKTGKATRREFDVNGITAWKAGGLVFTDMTMGQVAIELERRYGIEVIFKEANISGNIVSGTFSANEPVTDILDMLGFVGKFTYKYTHDGKIFTIQSMNKH
ncbi:FecR family protein [Chitinophaga nivalis]|uniref:DUF4974 domain-containing protein n=1 Tax=Chitinophaga nivalis TaxID=2991709 RepID=A0ABT3IET6_9BACT|nr:FecR domain-containing protein [Chitinophaga nivalis]MCW3467840.1 DUF4974 domain-containing protein [Chitinophaga nivalis]MCW3482468.1 DUF4974 domain-containing protein [Chitinophaga nivalis]